MTAGTTDNRKDDQLLVERVQKGDKRAFDLLVLKYQHRVMSIISRFIKDPVEVQDVAQEAFLKAYRAIDRFRGDSAFYTWVYRIAVNTAKNHLATRSRRPSSDVNLDDGEYHDDVQGLQIIDTPENSASADELKTIIEQALEDLPEDLRTALTLREYEGLGYEEIAEIMDCPVGTVRSRIFRARESVDEKVRPILALR